MLRLRTFTLFACGVFCTRNVFRWERWGGGREPVCVSENNFPQQADALYEKEIEHMEVRDAKYKKLAEE